MAGADQAAGQIPVISFQFHIAIIHIGKIEPDCFIMSVHTGFAGDGNLPVAVLLTDIYCINIAVVFSGNLIVRCRPHIDSGTADIQRQ